LSRRIIVGEEVRGGVENLAKMAEREKVSGAVLLYAAFCSAGASRRLKESWQRGRR
jgi:benzoyl-CoA reductase/2-hydroxyglutaryl-CoA dehydratase subunit BcrC/BadD/HgdB